MNGTASLFVERKERHVTLRFIYRESNFVLLLLFNVVVAATTVAGTDADERKDF